MQFIKVIGCNLNFSKGEREWKWSWLRSEFSKQQIKAAAFQSSVFTVRDPGLWYSRWNRNAIFECIPWNLWAGQAGDPSLLPWAVCSQHSWGWRSALSQCSAEEKAPGFNSINSACWKCWVCNALQAGVYKSVDAGLPRAGNNSGNAALVIFPLWNQTPGPQRCFKNNCALLFCLLFFFVPYYHNFFAYFSVV